MARRASAMPAGKLTGIGNVRKGGGLSTKTFNKDEVDAERVDDRELEHGWGD